MEAIYCACVLANLEGLNHNALLKEPSLFPTLTALDTRTQKLEGDTLGLLPPPPLTPLTWNSLAWRVARVSAFTTRHSTALQSVPEVPLSASPDLLDSIIASLNIRAPEIFSLDKDVKRGTSGDYGDDDDEKTVCDDKEAADEKRLSIIRQRLCFALGKRGKKIDRVPYDLPGTCSLALYLSLEIEKGVGPPPRPVNWGVPRMPPPCEMITMNPRCRCRCHKLKASGRKGHSVGSRIGGFFRKLAWWKKKDDAGSDSDTDSFCESNTTTSSGTSIIVDS